LTRLILRTDKYGNIFSSIKLIIIQRKLWRWQFCTWGPPPHRRSARLSRDKMIEHDDDGWCYRGPAIVLSH